MPQDMVTGRSSNIDRSTAATVFLGLCRIWQHLFHLSTKGNAGQAASPYNPKYLLLKMPYRFNTSYQLLAPRSTDVLCN